MHWCLFVSINNSTTASGHDANRRWTATQVYLRRWDRWRWAAPSRCRPSPKAAADRRRQTPGLWAGQSRRYASGSCLESGHLRKSSCPALVCSECISSASKQGKNMMRHKQEISRQKFTLKCFHGSCSESQSSVTNENSLGMWRCSRLKGRSNRNVALVPGCPDMQIWGGWSGQRWWA